VQLLAGYDSAIRQLCFGFDIWLYAINVKDKESFIHVSFLWRYPVASKQSVHVRALRSILHVSML
jgi:hypothetical protein